MTRSTKLGKQKAPHLKSSCYEICSLYTFMVWCHAEGGIKPVADAHVFSVMFKFWEMSFFWQFNGNSKFAIYVLKLNVTFCECFSVSVQNMVAYVMLVIVIFVLVYSLTISEVVAVTFPDTSCFIPCDGWNTPCWTKSRLKLFKEVVSRQMGL